MSELERLFSREVLDALDERSRAIAETVAHALVDVEHDEWLSYAAAARRIGCSAKTIERAVRRGDLPASRAAGDPRIAASDLDAWMRSGLGSAPRAQHSSPRRPRPDVGSFGALVKEDRRERRRRG